MGGRGDEGGGVTGEEEASVFFVFSHMSGSARPLIGFRLSVQASRPGTKSKTTHHSPNAINHRYTFTNHVSSQCEAEDMPRFIGALLSELQFLNHCSGS